MLYSLFSTEIGYNLNHLGLLGVYVLGENALLFPIMLALLAVSAFAGYLLGSINSAVMISKKLCGEDVRTYGSGNAGFTNMMRIYGGKAAWLTLLFDFLKPAAGVMLGWVLYGYMGAVTAGAAVIVGHIYPMFFSFRGGKGIVCIATVVLLLDWRIFLILFAVFALSLVTTKYVSLGSVLCAATLPIFMNRMYHTATIENARLKAFATTVTLIVVVIIIIKHVPNIKRITSGTESKFEFKRLKKTQSDGDLKND